MSQSYAWKCPICGSVIPTVQQPGVVYYPHQLPTCNGGWSNGHYPTQMRLQGVGTDTRIPQFIAARSVGDGERNEK
jgi:hypothetical protein